MNDLTYSAVLRPSILSSTSNSTPIPGAEEDEIRKNVLESTPATPLAAINDRAASTATTEDPITGSPSVRQTPPAPSIADAISTPFIDIRSIGIATWPIRGTQKWEGRVVEVNDDVFTAELTPLGGGDRRGFTSEFRTRELETESGLPEAGDAFYVTSQQVRFRGLLTTSYALHARKPGNWTANDIREIREGCGSSGVTLREVFSAC